MRKLAAVIGPSVLILLAGCSTGTPVNKVVTAPTGAVLMNGTVHGGQGPISGSLVQLWQVGTTGYATGATVLGSSTTSDTNGNFSITSLYNCTNAANGNATLVYITATGGNSGSGPNSQILLMAALGTCGSLTPSTHIIMNEVTTVAAVYALAQFISPTGNVGSYGYSNTGLANAFATVNNLVTNTYGDALATTPAGNGLVPQSEINSIANVLASCVNSASIGTSPSAPCASVFSAATPTGNGTTGSSAPTNSLAVARNIALYPWYNAGTTSTLFTLGVPNAPFVPALTSAPSDWSIAISFAGGGTSVRGLAIDSLGNVWTANYASGAAGSGSLSKLSPIGVPATNSPFTLSVVGPYAVAIDTTNNAWLVNHDSNQVVEYAQNGNTLAGPYQFTETNAPDAIAIDGSNNIWLANYGSSSLTEFNGPSYGSSGTTISPTGGYTANGLSGPSGIAFDSAGHAWVTNQSANTVSEFGPLGTVVGASPFSGSGLSAPAAIAIDSSGDAWVTNGTTSILSEFNSSGPVGSGYSGGGLNAAHGVAVDGSGRVFASTVGTNLAMFTNSGLPITTSRGIQGGNLLGPDALAIDGSGNVWAGNEETFRVNGLYISVSEFVGLAVPVITPLSSAVASGQANLPPGTPIPITVTSGDLPDYTPSVSYLAQLMASGGNTGSYTWSLANSSTLPSGLLLSSSGLISGTTTATGTTNFTVQVCDAGNATNCTTSATLSLTSTSSLPAGVNDPMLSGTYVVRLAGFNNYTSPGSGNVNGFAAVGSLVFDGNGNITSGEWDYNNPVANSSSAISVHGTYTVGSDQRGVMVVKIAGTPIQYAISVGTIVSGVAQNMRFIEFDDTDATGATLTSIASGVGEKQTSAAISLNQSFVFGLDGETPCTLFNSNGCTNGSFTPYGAVAAAGHFTGNASNTIVSGQQDGSANNTSYNGITLTGSYSAPDTFGRGTLTLTPTGTTFPLNPTHFTYYSVSPTEMYILSSDPHSGYTLLSGDVLAQTTTFTSSSTLVGNYVAFESAPYNGNGTNFFPNESTAELIYLSASGSQVTGYQDRNRYGSVQLAKSVGPATPTFDANGRMTIAPNGSGQPVFYFASLTQGFGVEQPNTSNSTGDTGLIDIEGQSGAPFSCTAGTGTSLLGTLHPPVPLGTSSGVFVKNGTTSVTGTFDNSDPSGVLTTQSLTSTCSADQNGVTTSTTGRLTYTSAAGSTSVSYIISPTKQVIISTTPSAANAPVIVIQK